MAVALASVAQASAVRTFVSFAGQDSNTSVNCSIANPCRTFAAAYSVTSSGGEIYAVNPVGYGPLTITGPVTIVGADVAGVNAFAGTTGITINAGATDMVVLRNLQITGNGAANTVGIALNSGKLFLQNSLLTGLTTGLTVAGTKAEVIDTNFVGNGTAISTTGSGTDFNCNPASIGPTGVHLRGGNVTNNGTAYFMHDPGFGSTPASCNRITIWAYSPNNTFVVNQIDNTTLVSGDGASCVTPGFCTQIGTYQSGVNQQNQP